MNIFPIFKKVCQDAKNKNLKNGKIQAKSIFHTKLEINVYYSNLIIIEDMKYENSNYFLSTSIRVTPY